LPPNNLLEDAVAPSTSPAPMALDVIILNHLTVLHSFVFEKDESKICSKYKIKKITTYEKKIQNNYSSMKIKSSKFND